jgi:hypothetical protein
MEFGGDADLEAYGEARRNDLLMSFALEQFGRRKSYESAVVRSAIYIPGLNA